MKSRQLKRWDLPRIRRSAKSLHIPVLLKGKKRFVCDIHFADNSLCYLEGAKGKPTKIRDLQLLLDARTADGIKFEIKRKRKKLDDKRDEVSHLIYEIQQLEIDYMELT